MHDARQIVSLEYPLVVLDDELLSLAKQVRARSLLGQRVDHPVVKSNECEMCLRDHEILIVSGIGNDSRPALRRPRPKASAWEIEAFKIDIRAGVGDCRCG